MSAQARAAWQTHEGMTGAGERDLPKDAASLHWYDAEGTSYHSAESQARKAAEPLGIPTHLQILPVSAPVLCVQLASKGGVAHVIAREY